MEAWLLQPQSEGLEQTVCVCVCVCHGDTKEQSYNIPYSGLFSYGGHFRIFQL